MIISYSLINAILLFNIAMLAIAMLRHQTGYLTKYSTSALLLLAMFGALRIILPFSFPFTIVFRSFETLPMMESILSADVWPGASRLEFQVVILLIWGTGSLVMLCWVISSLLKQHVYRQRYRVVENAQVDRVALGLKLKHSKIVVSPDVPVPYVMGFFRARIFLPDIAMEDDVLEVILKHEYQHFKSLDIFIKAFYTILSVVFWWNPIVHTFIRELNRLLEIRCDETLSKHMSRDEKILYMKSLLFIAEHIIAKDAARQISASSLVQVGQYKFMEQRLRLIMSDSNIKSTIKQIVSVALVVIVFMASFVFIIQPARMPPEYDNGSIFRVGPENAYIILSKEGSYRLYVDGHFVLEFDEIQVNYFEGLLIIEEE